ncbi:MAG: Rieske (2Fe-2S) protein [Planctomycetes bacterium]|nr:Rieske (2Fe-2S) protein [Planctomycetota bacterium]
MNRRELLSYVVTSLRAAMGLVVLVPGARFIAGRRRNRADAAGFVRVAALEALPPGTPVRLSVTRDRWDAYTRYPPGVVGSVWVLRHDVKGGDAASVRCYQAICPHLGCGTDYSPTRRSFTCPCHASDFDLAGRRVSGPSLRDMDELECRVTDPDPKGRRWVEVFYREFRTGTEAKVPVGV